MDKAGKILIICIIIVAIVEVLKAFAKKIIINNLYKYMSTCQYDKFEKTANGILTKYLIHPFNVNFMRLNVASMKNDKKEVEALVPFFEKMKLNEKQKESVYSVFFQFYVNQNDKKNAKKYYTKLNELENFSFKTEMSQVYDIYVNGGHKYLDDFLKQAKDGDDEVKLSLYPHIIKMYENQNDKKKADEIAQKLEVIIQKIKEQ